MKEIFKHSDGSDVVVSEKDYDAINKLTDEEIEEMVREVEEHFPPLDCSSGRGG